MIGIIFTSSEIASANMANFIISKYGFRKDGENTYSSKAEGMVMYDTVDPSIVHAERVDGLDLDVAYFLSRHRSAAGVAAFTTHSLGNWTGSAEVGGKPRQLSSAAPAEMFSMISSLVKIKVENMEKTYEATHHGPLLRTPSLFVEVGGPEEAIGNKKLAEMAAESAYSAVLDARDGRAEYERVVVGIGGGHYPEKFTKMAIEKGYAFSHIMPKYVMDDVCNDKFDILEQAMQRSNKAPELAVVEWKSLNAGIRDGLLKKLGELGLDYEKV